jgi:hypothetical protein
MRPQIVYPSEGSHNGQLDFSIRRIERAGLYRDCSTVCLTPSRGSVSVRVLQSWFRVQVPMNQKFARLFSVGMEVGAAYESMVAQILEHPHLSTWRYVLTLEEDNIPPDDGLLKLLETANRGYDAVGSLYWTKGYAGQPMIYGDPAGPPRSYFPQVPIPDTVQECRAVGMGFTLFRLDLFRRVGRPWFRTVQARDEGCVTQDIHFFDKAHAVGARVACDTRVKVGHYDHEGIYGPPEVVW